MNAEEVQMICRLQELERGRAQGLAACNTDLDAAIHIAGKFLMKWRAGRAQLAEMKRERPAAGVPSIRTGLAEAGTEPAMRAEAVAQATLAGLMARSGASATECREWLAAGFSPVPVETDFGTVMVRDFREPTNHTDQT